MPIKTQGDLPAKEILENENIFVMDESRDPSGHSSASGVHFKPDAVKRRYGAAIAACTIEHTITGGYYVFNSKKPRIAECICESSEQILYNL